MNVEEINQLNAFLLRIEKEHRKYPNCHYEIFMNKLEAERKWVIFTDLESEFWKLLTEVNIIFKCGYPGKLAVLRFYLKINQLNRKVDALYSNFKNF